MDLMKKVNYPITEKDRSEATMRMVANNGHELMAVGSGNNSRVILVKDDVVLYEFQSIYRSARQRMGDNQPSSIVTALEQVFKLEYWLNPTNRSYTYSLRETRRLVKQNWSPLLKDLNGLIFWLNGLTSRPVTPLNTHLVRLGPQYLIPSEEMVKQGLSVCSAEFTYHHLGNHNKIEAIGLLEVTLSALLNNDYPPLETVTPRWGSANLMSETAEETGALSYIQQELIFKNAEGRRFMVSRKLPHDADITQVTLSETDTIICLPEVAEWA